MKTLRMSVLLFALLGIAACGGQSSPGNTPTNSDHIIITNGTVVDGDPLEDIHALSQVVLVIKNGEVAFSSEGMLAAEVEGNDV